MVTALYFTVDLLLRCLAILAF
uniref:Uncharacterized protein n=1 Tax=Anguilla anguilla TaxID=7936 RepID=A0A0E9PXI9_ANGAN